MKRANRKKFTAARPHAKLSTGEVIKLLKELKGGHRAN